VCVSPVGFFLALLYVVFVWHAGAWGIVLFTWPVLAFEYWCLYNGLRGTLTTTTTTTTTTYS
jgi:hypothetical protein